MIKIKSLIRILKKNKVNFYTGVPDSVLKELSFYLQKKNKSEHVIAANEGSAVSIGIGYYLSNKKVPCVYMQNSGLSNSINPIISLAHPMVYSIPLILIIGWRGSPRVKDEPQHKAKGLITTKLLKLLKINYKLIRNNNDLSSFDKLIKFSKSKNKIVAALIEKGTLIGEENKNIFKESYKLPKQLFFEKFLNNINKNDKIISSTGFNSRELLFYRKKFNIKKGKDFYLVGGMGHTSSVSLGVNLINKKNNGQTICLDGDGSLLMHMGSLNTVAKFANKNFKYILMNNNSHDSVGGQSTYIDRINFKDLSKSLGFRKYFLIKNNLNLEIILKKFLKNKNLSFLEIRLSRNKVKKLPRPKYLLNLKKKFIK